MVSIMPALPNRLVYRRTNECSTNYQPSTMYVSRLHKYDILCFIMIRCSWTVVHVLLYQYSTVALFRFQWRWRQVLSQAQSTASPTGLLLPSLCSYLSLPALKRVWKGMMYDDQIILTANCHQAITKNGK